ncbi:TrmH family RNA methyltransferase [Paenibacillus lutrae]|uniref:RNA methyltransferase n=1 Tax=Paenibacillus lutrae TaxID=2078573 RepID=A0A7X3FL96_9BACL|nr:RNA methyltransferase [Paenibacillus lutrae]MVP01798.1 RNA methyltransferase [Paenibacillus lutrae]
MAKDNGLPDLASVQNSRVKEWAQLLDRKGRQKTGMYLIEGHHLVEEAVRAGAAVRTIVYEADKGLPPKLAAGAADAGIETVSVTRAIMERCTDTETPQGVFAVVDKPAAPAEALLAEGGAGLVVAVDGVQDPGNLGTIIRSADAVGAAAVVLGRGTVDLYNPKTIRSTMGSLFHLPIVEADLQELLPAAREAGRQIVVTSLQAQSSCYELDLTRPTWLVVGNEGRGVSDAAAAHATHRVIIPMQGQAESLNVAMATTVLLFEASRQRLL